MFIEFWPNYFILKPAFCTHSSSRNISLHSTRLHFVKHFSTALKLSTEAAVSNKSAVEVDQTRVKLEVGILKSKPKLKCQWKNFLFLCTTYLMCGVQSQTGNFMLKVINISIKTVHCKFYLLVKIIILHSFIRGMV